MKAFADNPPVINKRYLRQFPEFVEFTQVRLGDTPADEDSEELESATTPEESLEESYQNLRNAIAEELLDRVVKASPSFFEKLVVNLLVSMGYGGSRRDAGEAVGRSGDSGIDGIIKEDRLGLDAVYVQAKRWTDATVGPREVREFVGALEGHRARKGVFITTSTFTRDAYEFADRLTEKRIVLIDGRRMAELMIDYGVGVTEVASYSVKKVDGDFFGEE